MFVLLVSVTYNGLPLKLNFIAKRYKLVQLDLSIKELTNKEKSNFYLLSNLMFGHANLALFVVHALLFD